MAIIEGNQRNSTVPSIRYTLTHQEGGTGPCESHEGINDGHLPDDVQLSVSDITDEVLEGQLPGIELDHLQSTTAQ